VHPDEQIELLKAEAARAKQAKESSKKSSKTLPEEQHDRDDGANVESEHEWVLPTHLREKWSLGRFADVFDGISITPPVDTSKKDELTTNKWRTTKRMLMATIQDDSTIVYYIVHDGIVKPRQN